MSADDGGDCYRVETDPLALSVAADGDLLALEDGRDAGTNSATVRS